MRLIDADALRSVLEDKMKDCDNRHYQDGLAGALLYLLSRPIIEEHKHGHWTKDNKCSECGAQRPTQGINKWIYLDAKYCYACGAKMDEEV